MYGFFTILTDVLGLTKAALLIASDNDKIFKPLCISGFDDTTTLQIRIKKSEIVFPKNKYLLNKPTNLPLSHLFSSKDYGVMENLLVLPIFCGQRLSGIFLIADNPYLSIPQSESDMIFRPIQDLLCQLIEQHLLLCKVPTQFEAKSLTDISKMTELRMQMLDQRKDGKLIDFEFRECISYLLKEYPFLVPEAAYSDIRSRLLNNLQFYIRASFTAPGHCYVWLRSEAERDIAGLIKLCSIELSESMVSAVDYASNIASCLHSISMSSFLSENQVIVTA